MHSNAWRAEDDGRIHPLLIDCLPRLTLAGVGTAQMDWGIHGDIHNPEPRFLECGFEPVHVVGLDGFEMRTPRFDT
jgi:hypothetical protein